VGLSNTRAPSWFVAEISPLMVKTGFSTGAGTAWPARRRAALITSLLNTAAVGSGAAAVVPGPEPQAPARASRHTTAPIRAEIIERMAAFPVFSAPHPAVSGRQNHSSAAGTPT
jgi:hypothetical protein